MSESREFSAAHPSKRLVADSRIQAMLSRNWWVYALYANMNSVLQLRAVRRTIAARDIGHTVGLSQPDRDTLKKVTLLQEVGIDVLINRNEISTEALISGDLSEEERLALSTYSTIGSKIIFSEDPRVAEAIGMQPAFGRRPYFDLPRGVDDKTLVLVARIAATIYAADYLIFDCEELRTRMPRKRVLASVKKQFGERILLTESGRLPLNEVVYDAVRDAGKKKRK